MNGLLFYDGHRHVFLPLESDRPADQDRAVSVLSQRLLEAIERQGQDVKEGMNTAPGMRAVRRELERRAANQSAIDRAVESAADVQRRRRWLFPALTNYGRTV